MPITFSIQFNFKSLGNIFNCVAEGEEAVGNVLDKLDPCSLRKIRGNMPPNPVRISRQPNESLLVSQ